MIAAQSSLPRPDDCELDWGNAFAISPQGPGKALCAGDTIINPQSTVLRYGEVIRAQGFTRHSETQGIHLHQWRRSRLLLYRAESSVYSESIFADDYARQQSPRSGETRSSSFKQFTP
ncbi:DUF6636 domain-containing protein [Limoniibacter endophyticus]|uniref:DUF6636 domain-containing protein n=1 Tax=Limoniibacter endophyticus TaxID=1565040 RepID=UPI003618F8AD